MVKGANCSYIRKKKPQYAIKKLVKSNYQDKKQLIDNWIFKDN
jgi:hypothetical protein